MSPKDWPSCYCFITDSKYSPTPTCAGNEKSQMHRHVAKQYVYSFYSILSLTCSISFQTFCFQILPVIIFFSSVISVLYHFGIMQKVIRSIAWILQWTMHTTAIESLAASAYIFLGTVSMRDSHKVKIMIGNIFLYWQLYGPKQ